MQDVESGGTLVSWDDTNLKAIGTLAIASGCSYSDLSALFPSPVDPGSLGDKVFFQRDDSLGTYIVVKYGTNNNLGLNNDGCLDIGWGLGAKPTDGCSSNIQNIVAAYASPYSSCVLDKQYMNECYWNCVESDNNVVKAECSTGRIITDRIGFDKRDLYNVDFLVSLKHSTLLLLVEELFSIRPTYNLQAPYYLMFIHLSVLGYSCYVNGIMRYFSYSLEIK